MVVIDDYISGIPKDLTTAWTNSYEGRYSFTHRWNLRSRQSRSQFQAAVPPVGFPCHVGLCHRVDENFRRLSAEMFIMVDGGFRIRGAPDPWAEMECGVRVLVKEPHEEESAVVYERCVKLGQEVHVMFRFNDFSPELHRRFNERISPDADAKDVAEIVVTLKMPASLFKYNLNAHFTTFRAQTIPKTLDFRQAGFFDTSKHDYTIICADGRATAPKGSLLRTSLYFRNHFATEAGRLEHEMRVDAPVAAVNLILLYLITGCFRMDFDAITPAFAQSIIDLSQTHVPQDQFWSLYNDLTCCCSFKVTQIGDDLDELVKWLPFMAKCQNFRSTNFQSICTLLIAQCHWNDYLLEYIENKENLTDEKKKLVAELHRRDEYCSAHELVLRHVNSNVTAVEIQ